MSRALMRLPHPGRLVPVLSPVVVSGSLQALLAMIVLLAIALSLGPAHAADDDEDEAPAAAANADPAGRPAGSHQKDKALAREAAAKAITDDGEKVDALTRVRTTHVLRVGVYRNFTPFHDDAKGGIDDDIGAELAKRLGVTVSVQSYLAGDEMEDDFRNIIWKGHYLGTPVSDVMLHVPNDEALAKSAPQVQILAPYANEQTVVAYDREKLSGWKGLESLGSLRAGVENLSMPDLYLLSFGAQYKSQISHFPELHEAVAALKAGELAVVLGSRTKVESAVGEDAARYPNVRFNGGVYGRAIDLGVAVKAGEPALARAVGEALQAMREDGALQRIYAKHHATWVAPEPGG